MSYGEKPSIHPALAFIFPSTEPEGLDYCAAWNFFSHSLKRNAADLKLQVHRILFAIQYKQATYLAGSLHNLFTTLKDAGKNLRIRLLKPSVPDLSDSDKQYYASWVQAGEECSDAVTLPPLEEARSCMELRKLDVAKNILEDALISDPDNLLIKEKLEHGCINSYIQKAEETQEIENKKDKSTFGIRLKRIKNKLFN